MVENTPPIPQGNSAFKRWAQWVQRSILALRVNETPGALVSRTTRGVKVEPKRKAGGGGPSSPCPLA